MTRLTLLAALLILAPLTAAIAQETQEGITVVATAVNPDPERLPTLSVYQDSAFSQGQTLTMVRAAFPNVPGFVCDSWCYESPVDFLDATPLDGGAMQLRHRLRDNPGVLLVTVVTPEEGAVEFSARVELETPGQGALPDNPLVPNLCWQVRHAAGFASRPDPYPEFVKRCFIFTLQGRTFLDQTTRRLIPCRPPEDEYNNPPWVQMYVGTWQEIPQATPTSWSDTSPDRYTTPIIGVVSRDGKYLAALGNGSASLMCQAWHDCLHNNPPWVPADAPVADRRWRLKVYVMDNDPEKLLERVVEDFPTAKVRGE